MFSENSDAQNDLKHKFYVSQGSAEKPFILFRTHTANFIGILKFSQKQLQKHFVTFYDTLLLCDCECIHTVLLPLFSVRLSNVHPDKTK